MTLKLQFAPRLSTLLLSNNDNAMSFYVQWVLVTHIRQKCLAYYIITSSFFWVNIGYRKKTLSYDGPGCRTCLEKWKLLNQYFIRRLQIVFMKSKIIQWFFVFYIIMVYVSPGGLQERGRCLWHCLKEKSLTNQISYNIIYLYYLFSENLMCFEHNKNLGLF